MRKHEILSKLHTNWTCDFFIELVSKYEKPRGNPANPDIEPKKKEAPNNIAGLLGLQKIRSKPNSTESKDEQKIREIIEKTLANEAPEIKPRTKLHKIMWYRIWLYLVLRGVLNKDYFIEHYTG